jgi:hypothetical protein
VNALLRVAVFVGWLLLWWQHAAAQIEVTPAKPVAGEKTVARVNATIPEGATFQGGWSVVCLTENCQPPGTADLKEERAIGLWAHTGRYLLLFNGYWEKVGPEIIIKDVNGVEQKLRPFLGSGPVNHSLTLEVTGTNPPDPPDPPDPPVPPTPTVVRGIIVEETADRRQHPWLGNLLVQLRQAYPDGNKLLIPDQNQQSQTLQKYVQAAREAPLALPVLVTVAADGSVVGVIELPRSVEAFREIIK